MKTQPNKQIYALDDLFFVDWHPVFSDGDITLWLEQARNGDREASDRVIRLLFNRIYNKALRATKVLPPDASMNASVLVNEVFVKLLSSRTLERAPNRFYLYAAAATAMREVLADYYAKRDALKRKPPGQRLILDDVLDYFESQKVDFIELREALSQLEIQQPRKAAIIQARFFLGDKMAEVASRLGISLSTAETELRSAKLWLYKKLRT